LGGAGFGPREQGFDFYHAGKAVTTPSDTEGGKGEYDLTAQAEKFVEANRNQPFFLYLAHNSPHIPYSAREAAVAANRAAFEPVYAAVIETLDAVVGQLLHRLDALELAGNTIVIFTSDNGGLHVPELSHSRITHNTPYRAGKGFLYEGGLRVPLIVRWPNHVPAGRIVDAPVVNTDWLPTLLDCAGLQIPDNVDGVSLVGLLTGQSDAPHRSLVWHFPHYTNQGGRPGGAVRDGVWKLIEHYEDQRAELFNLADDVGETHDLAASEPERVALLRARLASWCKAMDVQTNSPNVNCEAPLHRALYEDIDISSYNPATADEAWRERVQAWRKQMDAVVPRR
jgi:arylsulfatase A-like enzyme